MKQEPAADAVFMRAALRLARRGYGLTSPNPMVGAVLVKRGRILGEGWHRAAGQPHAEIEALQAAARHGFKTDGATLYVTLEPCCTAGRTPPCTQAIVNARLGRVVVAATDPNPLHRGRAFSILKEAGIFVTAGVLGEEATRLNEAFNHWIVNRTPWVTVKAAMTLDGKIATSAGESKWITSEKSRLLSMRMRQGSDAILVGINTLLADDPALTIRNRSGIIRVGARQPRRIVLDSQARTPVNARLLNDAFANMTTIVVSSEAPQRRVKALAERGNIMTLPLVQRGFDLTALLKRLGQQQVTSLLVEGGGEVNASFLLGGFAHRIAFFYAPKVVCGCDARMAVAGDGIDDVTHALQLSGVDWRRIGPDILLTALVNQHRGKESGIGLAQNV